MTTPTEKLKEILEMAGKAELEPLNGLCPECKRFVEFRHRYGCSLSRARRELSRLDPTTITAIVRELLAWREFYADMVEHSQEALCVVCAEHMKDELPDSVRRYVDLDSEALRKIEEAGNIGSTRE